MERFEENKLAAIVAMSLDYVIGTDESPIPWDLPSDRRRFAKLTDGCVVIMGRSTWETLRGPLPGRVNVIISNKLGKGNVCFWEQKKEAFIAPNVEAALAFANSCIRDSGSRAYGGRVFVIGGAEVYKSFMPFVHDLYLTLVFTNLADLPRAVKFPIDELGDGLWVRQNDYNHFPDNKRDEHYYTTTHLQRLESWYSPFEAPLREMIQRQIPLRPCRRSND